MVIAGVQPTGEQLAVVQACAADANVVIEAGAGTGKTSTLRMVAATLDGRRGIYLAYNRATADAARRTFPSSVTCVTAHSLAYSAVGYRYGDRLPGNAPRMPSWAIANRLGITGPLPLGEQYLLTPAHQARIVMGTIESFCHSADTTVSAVHIPTVHGLDADASAELSWRIVPLARQAWLDIQRPDGKLPFKHDHYLKLWQLGGARIRADYVMFDEAQDANPVTASIIQDQPSGQRIIVGDSCQAIYGWRGAVDAVDDWPCDIRLTLTQSFRFGQAVATEANKWLDTLDARYRLAGLPTIESVVGTVTAPQVTVCRTNAEAFSQARAALDAGRRAAFGGSGRDLKYLAGAALDLQAAGRTEHPDLAAFRSWGQVLDYIRTDAAGADLAASIRLIEKYGAASILGTIDKLTAEHRAEIVACTAHAAKGREWERVLIASDFTEPSGSVIPRADAMLAYVAVTRARMELDRSGLAWIDTRLPTARKGTIMNTRKPVSTADPLSGTLRPYAGGRAQAESGCRIIATDYDSWSAVTTMPGDHPKVSQLAQAWRAIVKRELDDDPGPAATRYRILAHAASALAAADAVQATELAALNRLAGHARLHGDRLRATSDSLFARSEKAGPYSGGRLHAAAGSRIVEKDYLNWSRSTSSDLAARDASLLTKVKRLRLAWDEVRHRSITDGPGKAAARYGELAEASSALADEYTPTLPSVGLGLVLELASHSRKHAIRLRATAEANAANVLDLRDRDVEAAVESFQVLDIATRHSDQGKRKRPADDQVTNRQARVRRHSRARSEQDRQR